MHEYIVKLNPDEVETLAWLANRYETAAILYSHEDDGVITLSKSEAWRYLDELEGENSNTNQIAPTYMGGTLADKLITLWNEIV